MQVVCKKCQKMFLHVYPEGDKDTLFLPVRKPRSERVVDQTEAYSATCLPHPELAS